MRKSGDLVINPRTKRPIKVGGRTWLKLVREGVFEAEYQDENEICDIENSDDLSIEQRKINADKNLAADKHAVRGRGRHKNKLVIRNKRKQDIDDEIRTNHAAGFDEKTKFRLKKLAAEGKLEEYLKQILIDTKPDEDMETEYDMDADESWGLEDDDTEYSIDF